ncbi:MAG: hypothetical protein K0R46_1927 [Herbinix sp.]|jgi:hypothetical protein|nr:hypothetical protein [Herbinix sp.]
MKLWKKSMDVTDEDELSFRDRFMLFLRKTALMSFFGLVLAGIGLGVAWFILNQSEFLIQDVAFTEGIVIIMIGLMFGMKGNPFGMGMNTWSLKNSTAIDVLNMEASIRENKSIDNDKNFGKHSVVKFLFGRVTIILGGIFLVVISILFL